MPGQKSKEEVAAMTLDERVRHYYMIGNSPQAIARSERMTVEEVLHIIGMDDMTTVNDNTPDMIDQSEAGNAVLNHSGKDHQAHFDLS